ncbi:QWRF motif-containing protein 7-like [Canna indica]|uniref:QWRF motif-containing protein 7-like n=1 Tax=Canna indica TaxID=4628 RepID=A0AAQ3KEE4_9LILI|nr:QWRF motif-containing protein 7-like [Canna indica]
METARPLSPRSPLLLRSRSGASTLPRRAAPSPRPAPSFSSLSNSAPAALSRSDSASKNRPLDHDGTPAASPRRLAKENRKSLPPTDSSAAGLRKPRPVPSAWALSPGRSPPRSASAPAQLEAGGKKKKAGLSARLQSSGRTTHSPEPPNDAPVAAAGGKKGGGGGVLGLFRRRKESAPGEEESHQLRLLSSRLVQWRFANARAEAAVEASWCNAEEKLFHVWLRTYELRNLVAAKRILTQRRKQKVKLAQILQPQVHRLSQWEPHAKKHIEAVATLVRLLGSACLSLPLVEGAQANSVSLHRSMGISMEIMKEVVDSAGIFYSQVGDVDAILYELMKTIRLEMEGLEELVKICKRVSSLEMHEVSLRAHMIQAMKEEDDDLISYPRQHRLAVCKDAFTTPIRVVPYHTLVGTIY